MTTPPRRIASLLPSATEMVCLVGAGDRLVATSHECDFPPAATGLPRVTRSRLSLSGASAAVDADVRGLVEQALSVYEVDVDALERAAPELIVTQDLCEVCAVSRKDVEAALCELPGGARLLSLSPTTLDEVLDDVLRVGDAVGERARAEREVAALRARIDAIAARAAACATRPRVLTIEWLDPVMIGGLWMPELIELAGGEPMVTQVGEHAPTLDRDALAALDPEVVLIKPCGYPLERTRAESALLDDLLDGMPWTATTRGDVWLADGNAFFNRPGPRLVESLEILAACVHPDAFGDFATRHAAHRERRAPQRSR